MFMERPAGCAWNGWPDAVECAVLTALAINPAPDTEAKTAQTERLENIQSLKALKEKLDEHSWLRDRYIVYPNVTGEGKFSLLRNGMMAKYKEMPFVGGYVDGLLGDLKAGPLSILAGKDKNWGNKRIACIQTSDNRRSDHADLGKSTSWIKWARPTAEALRQACLAQESRVSQEEPRFPAAIISSISVSNSQFLGPIDLSFNPQYNALIGGRGTGKSTILEYLRWALCDQPPATDDPDAPNYQSRRSRLIDNTLKPLEATVDVTFTVNDVVHVVRRDSKDGGLLIKIGADEMRECNESEVRTLLPIQAYSQKQLSDVSVRTDELSRFITAPIRMELGQLDRRIDERAGRIRQTYANKRRLQSLQNELSKRDLEARSLQGQADAIRDALTGLSEEDRNLINMGRAYDEADKIVETWLNDLRSVGTSLSTLSATIATKLEQPTVLHMHPDRDMLQAAGEQRTALLTGVLNTINELLPGIRKPVEDPDASPWADWKNKLQQFRDEYSAAVQRSSTHRERMEQLQEIEARLTSFQRETAGIQEELTALSTAGDIYNAERQSWFDLKAERDGHVRQCGVILRMA